MCGADNTAAGGPDLRARTKLYYLNPLDLLQPSLAFLAARSVCVAACPDAADQCSVASLPCAADHEYRRDPDALTRDPEHRAAHPGAAGQCRTAPLPCAAGGGCRYDPDTKALVWESGFLAAVPGAARTDTALMV